MTIHLSIHLSHILTFCIHASTLMFVFNYPSFFIVISIVILPVINLLLLIVFSPVLHLPHLVLLLSSPAFCIFKFLLHNLSRSAYSMAYLHRSHPMSPSFCFFFISFVYFGLEVFIFSQTMVLSCSLSCSPFPVAASITDSPFMFTSFLNPAALSLRFCRETYVLFGEF